MSSFFPALQNSLLSRLLLVSVLVLLATIALMVTVGSGTVGGRTIGSGPEGAASSAPDHGVPLFISGGTSAPASGSVTQ